jgi:hypothetical protein
MAVGKLALAAADMAEAAAHFQEAARAYSGALQRPEALGDLRERSDVRHVPVRLSISSCTCIFVLDHKIKCRAAGILSMS